MNFTIEQRDRAAIFRPQEPRLDSLVVPELKAEFLILSQPDVETLIIDLTDVEYIDSAGLSALLLARRQQTAHDGDVRLVGVRDEVKSLLELTQLNRVFPIYDTTQQALEAPQLSAIVVGPDDLDTTTSALSSGMRSAAVGVAAGAAVLGAVAIGEAITEDGFSAFGDDEEYEDDGDDEDFDDDDDEYYDDEDDDEDSEEEEDGEEEDGEESNEDEEEDDDFEYDEEEEYDFEDDDEEEEEEDEDY